MAPAGSAPQPLPWRTIWLGPLVAGLSFGLAYGITQRLVTLNVGELIRFGPGFDVQVFPGTSLESLKLRFGEQRTQLWADLELQQLERQQQQEAKQRAQQAAELERQLQQRADPEPAAELPAEPLPPEAPPDTPALPEPPADPR